MAVEAVASLDIGSSSARVLLFDLEGRLLPVGGAQHSYEPTTSIEGESTLDADQLVDAALECLEKACNAGADIVAVGSATFWHSVVGVDATGHACTPVYLWSDTRSSRQVEMLRESMDEREVHRRTGCVFHTSYLPARLLWLREAEPGLAGRVHYWMSPGEYLYLRLFGDRRCSISMASGTGLLNQDTLRWDETLLERIGVSDALLSPLADLNSRRQGLRPEFAQRLQALAQVPWFLTLGDGACSNLGSGGVDSSKVTLMVGTSGAMRILGGPELEAPRGLWKYRLDAGRCLVGGALSNGGVVHQWLAQTLQLPNSGEMERQLAQAAPDSHGLTMLPFLLGERSPDWYARATGSLLGITAATTAFEIAQASLEAVAYRFARVYRLLAPLADGDHVLLGTGAALTHSPAWAQILVDVLGRAMYLPESAEGTARGVALAVLEQLGCLPNLKYARLDAGTRLNPRPETSAQYSAGIERHEAACRMLAEGLPTNVSRPGVE